MRYSGYKFGTALGVIRSEAEKEQLQYTHREIPSFRTLPL